MLGIECDRTVTRFAPRRGSEESFSNSPGAEGRGTRILGGRAPAAGSPHGPCIPRGAGRQADLTGQGDPEPGGSGCDLAGVADPPDQDPRPWNAKVRTAWF